MAKQPVTAASPYPGPAPEKSIPAGGDDKSGGGSDNALSRNLDTGMAKGEPIWASSAGTSAALLLFLQVLQPPPGHLALAAALIGHRDLPGQLEIGARQQSVCEQELRQLSRVTPFLPDEVLQQLLVVGDCAFAAQIEGDGDFGHRHRLRGGPAEDVLLVEEGHRHPGGAVAIEVGTDVRCRLRP